VSDGATLAAGLHVWIPSVAALVAGVESLSHFDQTSARLAGSNGALDAAQESEALVRARPPFLPPASFQSPFISLSGGIFPPARK
jgi:hypothetical protein